MLFSIENILGMSSKDKTSSEEHTARAPRSKSAVAESSVVEIDKEPNARQLVCHGRKRNGSDCSIDRYSDEDKSADEAESLLGEGENRSITALQSSAYTLLPLLLRLRAEDRMCMRRGELVFGVVVGCLTA